MQKINLLQRINGWGFMTHWFVLVFVKSIKALKEFLEETVFCVTCRVLSLIQARQNESQSGSILDLCLVRLSHAIYCPRF